MRKFVSTFEEGAFLKAVEANERFEENAAKIAALQELKDTSVPNARKCIILPPKEG